MKKIKLPWTQEEILNLKVSVNKLGKFGLSDAYEEFVKLSDNSRTYDGFFRKFQRLNFGRKINGKFPISDEDLKKVEVKECLHPLLRKVSYEEKEKIEKMRRVNLKEFHKGKSNLECAKCYVPFKMKDLVSTENMYGDKILVCRTCYFKAS